MSAERLMIPKNCWILVCFVQALQAASQNIHAVLGNSSCDLDSVVCALVYGFFQYGSSVELHVPVLNICRADYSLRTDVTHVLGRCGLSDSNLLTFRDDIDLHLLHSNGQLKLTLVDCHVLSREDSVLDDAVVEVIDHRPRARPDQKGYVSWVDNQHWIGTLYNSSVFCKKQVNAVRHLYWIQLWLTVMSYILVMCVAKEDVCVGLLRLHAGCAWRMCFGSYSKCHECVQKV